MNAADPIGDVQDALIARIAQAFASDDGRSALKKVEAIEVPFDTKTPSTFRPVPPSVFVMPMMVRPTGVLHQVEIRWAAYAMSNRATSRTRTRGGVEPFGIGSYAIAARVYAALDQWKPDIDCASTIEMDGIENITGLAFVDQKLNIWAVSFGGTVTFDIDDPAAELGDFLIFDADFDLEPFEEPTLSPPADLDADLTVELPQ